MEPDAPPRLTDDVSSRATVTLRPFVTYVLIFDCLAGRANYRTMSFPLMFPPPPDPSGAAARTPRTWIGRRATRQRAEIRRQFDARGYDLPA